VETSPAGSTATGKRLDRFSGGFGGVAPPEPAWTDARSDRYVSDAGPLLTRPARADQRADCIHKEPSEGGEAGRAYDGLEQRIPELSAAERTGRLRPELDGNEIMRVLGVPTGPVVGRAYDSCLSLRNRAGASWAVSRSSGDAAVGGSAEGYPPLRTRTRRIRGARGKASQYRPR